MKWLPSTLVLLCICSFLLLCAGCGKKAATEAKPVTPPTASTPAPAAGATGQAAPAGGNEDPAYLPVEGESSEMPPDATMPKAPKPGVRLPD